MHLDRKGPVVGMRQIATAVLAGVAVSTLAACSVSSGAAPEPGAAGNPAASEPAGAAASNPGGSGGQASAGPPAPYCAQAPATEVGATLGLTLGKQVSTLEGPVSVCAYLGKYMVMVRYQTGESARQFRQSQQSLSSLHQTVRAVSGVGDKAYFASVGTAHGSSNTLAALSGTVAVFVTAPRPLATERTLMKHLLAKI
jgi:hypothetical protein